MFRLSSQKKQGANPRFALGQKDTKIGDRYVEMMVVMDKAAVEMHKNTEEVKRYVITYLRLVRFVSSLIKKVIAHVNEIHD